jgi:hypothetical protein
MGAITTRFLSSIRPILPGSNNFLNFPMPLHTSCMKNIKQNFAAAPASPIERSAENHDF